MNTLLHYAIRSAGLWTSFPASGGRRREFYCVVLATSYVLFKYGKHVYRPQCEMLNALLQTCYSSKYIGEKCFNI